MAITAKMEQRALDADEKELVEKSHHPQVQELSDSELHDLTSLLRERREKARTVAHRRRREMRGKAPAQGATASRADDGSKLKLEVLATAMRRLNNEVDRRRRMSAQSELVSNARKALKLKNAGEDKASHPNSRTAHAGMREVSNRKAKNLVRPMELGRQRKAASVAQAKRDAK